MQKSKMEVESVMGENGEGSNNVIIRQHEEDENESRPVGNIEGDASGDKQDSPRGKSSKRRKYSKHRANKKLLEHHENVIMKEENRKHRIEQLTLKAAMKNPICSHCDNKAFIVDLGADERQTMFENDRLKEEVKRIRVFEDKLLGPSASLKRSMASLNK
ncbi:hypothetical protein P3S68_001427 [Capsicum galapagoense]